MDAITTYLKSRGFVLVDEEALWTIKADTGRIRRGMNCHVHPADSIVDIAGYSKKLAKAFTEAGMQYFTVSRLCPKDGDGLDPDIVILHFEGV